MATVGSDPNGRKRILFVAGDGRRKTIRLGKATMKQAEAFKVKLEALIAARITGNMPDELSRWLAEMPHTVYDRLVRVGLAEPRSTAPRPTVADFTERYIAERADLKESTLTILRQSRIWLIRFLGKDRRLDDVSRADADAYRAHMVKSHLARASIAKRLRYARHFFDVAVRRGLIDANPFEHIKGLAVKGDPKRRMFVSGEVVRRVMEVIPDPQWRLLIALARWGGLRIPSEAAKLTWADVDFANKRFIVRSSKTEHHDDGGVRVVPIFPELAGLFQECFDAAEEGAVYVLPMCRNNSVNLRTQFRRFIERAGEKPWPKLWQNLRVSRATELADL